MDRWNDFVCLYSLERKGRQPAPLSPFPACHINNRSLCSFINRTNCFLTSKLPISQSISLTVTRTVTPVTAPRARVRELCSVSKPIYNFVDFTQISILAISNQFKHCRFKTDFNIVKQISIFRFPTNYHFSYFKPNSHLPISHQF